MSFIIPKKPQILYAPMLGSLGGGSARGFGRGVGGGAGIGPGYFGSQYSGFSNVSPILALTSSTGTEATGVTAANNRWDSLDTFFDFSGNKIWGAYNTVSYYSNFPYNNNNGTWSGSDTYYTIAANTRGDISGQNASGIAAGGRGLTIAYLSDASRTPVVVVGGNGDSHDSGHAAGGLFFFNYSTGAFLGRLIFEHSTGFSNRNISDLSGLAWDGEKLLVVARGSVNTPTYGATGSMLYRFTLPASITNSNASISIDQEVPLPHPLNYGLSWYGSGVYMASDLGGYSGVSQIELNFSDGTSTLIGTAGKFNTTAVPPEQIFSATVDYRNRRLVLGGYNLTEIRSFGET
jgi:hypothetical protein